MNSDAVDLESLAAPRNPRVEKRVQSMGKHGKQPKDEDTSGTMKTTC